jgi:Domain of unknown function (DUF1707)/2TM domain
LIVHCGQYTLKMTVHYGQYTAKETAMCYSTLKSADPLRRLDRTRREPGFDAPDPNAADPNMRASDAERDATVDMLSDAAAEGYLTPEELDERLGAALGARTIEDLTRLTQDLPPKWQAERSRRTARAAANREARDAVRRQVATYLCVMAVLVVIWLIAGVTAGAWYPWPIWPALGWGIALVARVRSGNIPASAASQQTQRAQRTEQSSRSRLR